MMCHSFTLCFTLLFITGISSTKDDHSALVLKKNDSTFTLAIPNHELMFPKDDQLYFGCPANDARQQMINQKSASKRTLFLTKGETKEIITFDHAIAKCAAPVQSAIKEEAKLSEEGTSHQRYFIGYEIYIADVNKDKHPDNDQINKESFYFMEILIAELNVTKMTRSLSYRLNWKPYLPIAPYVPDQLHYDRITSKEMLHNMDEDFQEVDKILSNMTYETFPKSTLELGIQKTQLIPRDDFLLDNWKLVTYFNINIIPIWKVLLLRWKEVEIFLRKVAQYYQYPFEIKTGTYSSLDLQEILNILNRTTFHVPLYLWKIIKAKVEINGYIKENAILILMHNDPINNRVQLCQDVCLSNGWLISNDDYKTGLIYCCELSGQILQTLDINEKGHKVLDLSRDDLLMKALAD